MKLTDERQIIAFSLIMALFTSSLLQGCGHSHCAEYRTVERQVPQSHNSCYTDVHGFQHCNSVSDGMTTVYDNICIRSECDYGYVDIAGKCVINNVDGEKNDEFGKKETNKSILASAEDYYNRGRNFGKMADFADAIANYTKAIELNPTYAKAYYFRGLSWAAKANFNKAIADFTKVIEIEPKNAEAYFFRGQSWAGKGDLGKSAADYTKANEINPNLLNR